MLRSTNVGTLAIEHFQELKEAWQFEHDEHQRLDKVVISLSDDVASLEEKVAVLERDLNVEELRYSMTCQRSLALCQRLF